MSDGPRAAPAAPSSEPPSPDDADREIVEALSRSETRLAISLCAERHAPSIGRLCMAMLGSQREADDLTLETLLTAHEAFDDFRGEGSLRVWLLGIARHKCLERLEKGRQRGAPSRLDDGHATASADEVPAARRRAEGARALLERVRPSDREALLLRYGAELSFEEVAAASGIDDAAARQRVSRALLRLRSVLESEHDDD